MYILGDSFIIALDSFIKSHSYKNHTENNFQYYQISFHYLDKINTFKKIKLIYITIHDFIKTIIKIIK